MIDPTIRFIDAIRSLAEHDLTVEEMAAALKDDVAVKTLKSAISRLQEVVECWEWRGSDN